MTSALRINIFCAIKTRRSRSNCLPAQDDQGLGCPLIELLDAVEDIEQTRPYSAHADLDLPHSHVARRPFSQVVHQVVNKVINDVLLYLAFIHLISYLP